MFRGWIVVVSCFCVYLSIGISFSYTEFFLPLTNQFGWSYSTSSVIPAVSTITSSLCSLLAGYVLPRLGYRRTCVFSSILVGGGTLLSGLAGNFIQLLVAFGILASIGNAFMLVASTSLVINWFVKNRGIAVGAMSSGSGAGAILVPFLANYLIRTSGWRLAFMFIGGFFLVILLVASFYLQMPKDLPTSLSSSGVRIAEEGDDLESLTLRQSLFSRKFWLLYMMLALGTFGVYIFSVHAVPFAESNEINSLIATEAIASFGAGSLFSRVVMGALTDRIKPASVLVISFGLGLISISFLTMLPGVIDVFVLAGFGIGFAYGGYIAEFTVLAGDLFGKRLTPKIWGIFETSLGLGGLAGPLIAGILFDIYHSYTLTFEIASLATAIAFVLSLFFLMDTKNPIVRKSVLSSDKSGQC